MFGIKTAITIGAAVSIGMASISGIVTDTSGNAVSGATATLEGWGLTATTSADGKFTISFGTGTGGWSDGATRRGRSATIEGGLARLHVPAPSAVAITTFDLSGKTLATTRRVLNSGTHFIVPPGNGTGVHVCKITIGRDEFILKSARIDMVSRGSGAAARNSSNPGASAEKAVAAGRADDVMTVTKAGYLDNRMYVTLDTSGLEITIIPSAGTVTDADGNVYHTVKFGNQIWMAEHLRTTKYSDGTPIPHVPENPAWEGLATPGYCFYQNTTDPAARKKYGALYNWHAVNTKKLAPAGWRVPGDADFTALTNYLITNGYNWDGTKTGNNIGKSMALKTDWVDENVTGTVGCDAGKNNRSGFSCFPAGDRARGIGFEIMRKNCTFWSATEENATNASICGLSYSASSFLQEGTGYKTNGYSVRLVKD